MKKERGSIWLYGLLALAVTAFAGTMVWTYKNAIVRAEQAETDARASRERLDEALAENVQIRLLRQQEEKLLLGRRQKEVNMTDLERRIDALLAKHLQRPEVREWAGTAIPPAILDGLRTKPLPPRGPPDREAKPAGKPVADLPNSGLLGGQDKLGLVGACQETPVHCAFLYGGQERYRCLVPTGGRRENRQPFRF